jgi:hypothetical protein
MGILLILKVGVGKQYNASMLPPKGAAIAALKREVGEPGSPYLKIEIITMLEKDSTAPSGLFFLRVKHEVIFRHNAKAHQVPPEF